MKIRHLFVLALLSIWMAIPASAQTRVDDWTGCDNVASSVTEPWFGSSDAACFEFDTGTSASTRKTFRVRPEAIVTLCLEPDITGAGAAATVDVERCIEGPTASANTCTTVLAAALDGTGGNASTQKRCQRLTRGIYQLEIVTTTTGTHDAIVSIVGEE